MAGSGSSGSTTLGKRTIVYIMILIFLFIHLLTFSWQNLSYLFKERAKLIDIPSMVHIKKLYRILSFVQATYFLFFRFMVISSPSPLVVFDYIYAPGVSQNLPYSDGWMVGGDQFCLGSIYSFYGHIDPPPGHLFLSMPLV